MLISNAPGYKAEFTYTCNSSNHGDLRKKWY